MKTQKNKMYIISSIICILASVTLLFFSMKSLQGVDDSIGLKNNAYKEKIKKAIEEETKIDSSLSEVNSKLNLLDQRKTELQNLVISYDYDKNKFNADTFSPMNLYYNSSTISNVNNIYTNSRIKSVLFKDVATENDEVKTDLLFSSILQNDFIINDVNYNLIRSNLEVYKYNGILAYYNGTNNYFLKSKLKIESKDKLNNLQNNMLAIRKLGVYLYDHLSFNNNNNSELKRLSSYTDSNDLLPDKYIQEFNKKLLFGTEIYNVISNFTNYVKIDEMIANNATLKIMRDFRGRVDMISELSNDIEKNYYYDNKGKVYKIVELTDEIKEIDLTNLNEVNHADSLYKAVN